MSRRLPQLLLRFNGGMLGGAGDAASQLRRNSATTENVEAKWLRLWFVNPAPPSQSYPVNFQALTANRPKRILGTVRSRATRPTPQLYVPQAPIPPTFGI
uniref:Uncharacterized protein n=1 Tax=Photinus pyralis TaxID=7054 RepID=A0A1Y1M1L6_PHOPY